MNIPWKIAVAIIFIAVILAGIAVAIYLREPKLSKEEMQQMLQEQETSHEIHYRLTMPHPEYINELCQIIETLSKAKSLDEISLSEDQAKKLLPILKDIQQTLPGDWESWRVRIEKIKTVWGKNLDSIIKKQTHSEKSTTEEFTSEELQENPFAWGKRKELLDKAIKTITKEIKLPAGKN